jgi:hypothetical protein
MNVVRSVAAVLVGYAVVAAALRLVSSDNFVAAVSIAVLGALIAGFVTAWIAGRRELPHAAGVGMLIIAMSVATMIRQGDTHPGWFETAIAGCGPIAALLGAALRMLTKRPTEPSPTSAASL